MSDNLIKQLISILREMLTVMQNINERLLFVEEKIDQVYFREKKLK